MDKYKSHFVEKGYYQVEGIDLGEIFSPVEKLNYNICLLAIDVSFDLEVE